MGIATAFLSAVFFGLNNATARRGVAVTSVNQAVIVTISVNLIFFVAVAILSGRIARWHELSLYQVVLLVSAGVLNYVIGRYFNYRSIQIIGAVSAGPILQTGMIVSVAAGVWGLNETLTMDQAFGVFLILVGSFMVISGRNSVVGGAQAHKVAEGYVCAVIGSIGYGLAPVLVRMSSGNTELGVLSGLVAFFGAQLVVAALVAVRPSELRGLFDIKWTHARWLVLTGIINGCAQLCLFIALTLAPVSLVVPIQRVAVVFRVLFSFLINRRLENFSVAVLAGTAVSLLGAVIISLG